MRIAFDRGQLGRRRCLMVVTLVSLAISGCGDDDGPPGTSEPGASLSESQAIGVVKAYLDVASKGVMESRSVPRSTPCPPGSTDPACVPCAPSSPNLCRTEWVTEQVEGPPRCPFPPSPQASWNAEYHLNGVWDVESSDPFATGTNRWTVDDGSASILSGYCYP